jgi:glycosyltransferase involved in cell wall biosynthesis
MHRLLLTVLLTTASTPANSTLWAKAKREDESNLAHSGDPPLVTFIIASYSRWTLERTLESLVNQTDPSWRAVVALDGSTTDKTNWLKVSSKNDRLQTAPPYLTLPEFIVTEPRIQFLTMPVTGSYRFGGAARNRALENEHVKAMNSAWVAFVDDDDTLTSDYVSLLRQEVSRSSVAGLPMSNISAVVFRAKMYNSNTIVPSLDENTLSSASIRISFALRANLGLRFRNGCTEPLGLLKDLVRSGTSSRGW